jgi:hypothetical protein
MLILIHVSICYVIFKIFKIPINQWSLATSALGGIIGIALLLLIVTTIIRSRSTREFIFRSLCCTRCGAA